MPRKHQNGSFEHRAAPGGGDVGCEHPGCDLDGNYPAPRSKRDLHEYRWFCLEHIREYNKSWDFYAGMDTDAIERERREDVIWRRPTWPLGASGKRQGGADQSFQDGFGLFEDAGPEAGTANGQSNGHPALGVEERDAMDILDLSPPLSEDAVRNRYKELVKRLHPDANGGDKQAEERLKLVNHAYTTLKTSLSFR